MTVKEMRVAREAMGAKSNGFSSYSRCDSHHMIHNPNPQSPELSEYSPNGTNTPCRIQTKPEGSVNNRDLVGQTRRTFSGRRS